MKIKKSEFLAEFFCTEVAAEIIKDSGGHNKLIQFANILWDQIDEAQELEDHSDGIMDSEDDDDDHGWKSGF